jgi:hypothetical protein
MAPECWSEQHEKSEDLKPTHEHSQAQDNFSGFADASVVTSHFAEPRPQIIQGGGYGRKRGWEVQSRRE